MFNLNKIKQFFKVNRPKENTLNKELIRDLTLIMNHESIQTILLNPTSRLMYVNTHYDNFFDLLENFNNPKERGLISSVTLAHYFGTPMGDYDVTVFLLRIIQALPHIRLSNSVKEDLEELKQSFEYLIQQ